jgi:hypothetical protein
MIAGEYIFRGSFLLDLIAFFPYQIIFPAHTESDPEGQLLRNVLFFKMIRIYRFASEFINAKQVENIIDSFYECSSRDDKIAMDR